jgi:DNA-binding MarR family transcriptional regulator
MGGERLAARELSRKWLTFALQLLADKQLHGRRVAVARLSHATMTPLPGPTDALIALAGEDVPRLRAVIGRLSRRLRPTAAGAAAGLTPTRVSVLLHVVREGPLRLSELAETEGINPTMLSRVVSDLGDAGLLQRVSDERDRRAAWVKATAAGKRLAERMRRERTDALTGALDELTVDQRATLERALPALEALAEALKSRPNS